MLLSLRGTPVLYQGDEIGLVDTDVPHERMHDPLGVLYWPAYAGRDAMRTPMPWNDGPGGGFTDPGMQPWLPFGDLAAYNVDAQRDDGRSMLALTRDLLALRRATPELRRGAYRSLPVGPESWAWSRDDRVVVMAGMSDGDAALEGFSGRVLVGTDRRRDGERVGGALRVRGWEGLVAERD